MAEQPPLHPPRSGAGDVGAHHVRHALHRATEAVRRHHHRPLPTPEPQREPAAPDTAA